MFNGHLDSIEFYKMHGCGNDFILIDNRRPRIEVAEMAPLAVATCDRHLGIGADGLLFLEDTNESGLDFRWHFYNADGSRAEMCGNASRCAARLALEIGLAGPVQNFATDAGPIHAEVDPDGKQVTVQLTTPRNLILNQYLRMEERSFTVHSVDTGVPHAVIICDDLDGLDVASLGSALRHHEYFAPAGANINFVRVENAQYIALRTYERGVEAETLACGTGAAAAFVVCRALGLVREPLSVRTSGGETLVLSSKDDKVFLTGAAVKVFRGRFFPTDLVPFPHTDAC